MILCLFFFLLKDAARSNSQSAYAKFVETTMENVRACTLRGQFELVKVPNPVDIGEVEEAKEIVKRFATGNGTHSAFYSTLLVFDKFNF